MASARDLLAAIPAVRAHRPLTVAEIDERLAFLRGQVAEDGPALDVGVARELIDEFLDLRRRLA